MHVWAYGIVRMPKHMAHNQWGAGRRWMVLIYELTPFLITTLARQTLYREGHLQRVMCTVLEADVLLCFMELRRLGTVRAVLSALDDRCDAIAEPWYDDTLSGIQYCTSASATGPGGVYVLLDLDRDVDTVRMPHTIDLL